MDKSLQPAALAAAYWPVQKHKVTAGIPGLTKLDRRADWMNDDQRDKWRLYELMYA